MRFPQAISNRKKGSTAASAARSSGTTIKTLSGSRRAMRARATRGCTLTKPLERTRALASPDSEPCASAKKVRLACLRASFAHVSHAAGCYEHNRGHGGVGRGVGPCEGRPIWGRPMWAPAAAPHRFLQPKRRARRGGTNSWEPTRRSVAARTNANGNPCVLLQACKACAKSPSFPVHCRASRGNGNPWI